MNSYLLNSQLPLKILKRWIQKRKLKKFEYFDNEKSILEKRFP